MHKHAIVCTCVRKLKYTIVAILKLSIVLVVPTFIRSSSDADSFAY